MSEIDNYLKSHIEIIGKGDELHTVYIKFDPIRLMVQELLSVEIKNSVLIPYIDGKIESELKSKIRNYLFRMIEEDIHEHPTDYSVRVRLLFGVD
jgi:hypothetical protein